MDDWDDLCVNPHGTALAAGRTEGRQAGLQAGYQDGWRLGQTTALEYGMEIGFMHGVLRALQSHNAVNDPNSKAHKTWQDLRDAMEQFPTAETMFAASSSPQPDVHHARHSPTNDSEQDATDDKNVRHLLQRMRARFRLLMVQLKMPHLSLPTVLQNDNDSSTRNTPTGTEW